MYLKDKTINSYVQYNFLIIVLFITCKGFYFILFLFRTFFIITLQNYLLYIVWLISRGISTTTDKRISFDSVNIIVQFK